MYINPIMGLNASCFFSAQKKNICQSYHPAYHSPVSFRHTLWHRHRKRWASVTDVGSTIIQHWFNAYCLLCFVASQFVITFQFVINYYKLERICNTIASQFVIIYYNLERNCSANAFQFVIIYYKLERYYKLGRNSA